jgi:hypothetical protein
MRGRACVAGLAIALVQGMLGAPPAQAQTTGTPTTVWSFLGVPNPFGTNAAAQQSSNPAIQAAAKAKAAKHEICKKKAAIQYLAGLGCTPEHPEVMPALMAAMDDPDEQVRYEAVKAVLQTAEVCQSPEQKKATRKAKGMSETCKDWKKACEKQFCDAVDRLCGKAPPKEHKHKLKKALKSMVGDECEDPAKEDCPCADRRGSCCSQEMRDKLMKLAYGRDDMGCFLEPSKRVRDLAEQALNACNACACGCEGATGTGTGMDHVVREMPPVDDRETRPSDSVPLPSCEPCFDDRLVMPPASDPHEMVPTPAPLPEPEAIPAPAASMDPPGTRSVLVRAPAAEPLPTAVARMEAVWRPLDPTSPFGQTDAAEIQAFLDSLNDGRSPAPSAAGATQARSHAEARLAFVPTPPDRGLNQPIARPVIRRAPPPRHPAGEGVALRDVVLGTPIDLRAVMDGAVAPHDSGPWPALPRLDPLDEVRRLSGQTIGPAPASSPPVPPTAATGPRPVRQPLPAPEASGPPPVPVAAPPVAAPPVAAPPVAAPPVARPTTNLPSHDTLRWLAIACLVASLPLAYVAWTDCTRSDTPPTVPGDGDMMRRVPRQHHPGQRS